MINLSQQFSVAVWSDDPGSDNQTLIETLVEMREVVGTVVDIIVAHCLSLMTQNRRQTMGRLVAVAGRVRAETTNNNHFGGKGLVASLACPGQPGSNWTGGILRHFIAFRYKQDFGDKAGIVG